MPAAVILEEMSTGSSQGTVFARVEPLPAIRWRVWPLKDRPWASALVIAGLAALAAFVHWSTAAVHLALFAAVVAALGLCRFFLPTQYELSVEGVAQQVAGRRRRIPWHAVGRYEVFADGVMLLPAPDPRPLDAFQGVFLPWIDRREEVLDQVHHYLGEAADPPRDGPAP